MVRSPLSVRSQVSTLTSFLEKLDDELFKALQLTDVHTAQYQERLGASVRGERATALAVPFQGGSYSTRLNSGC